MEDLELSQHSNERRTVLKGAAWSLPVIAAAVAAPAAVASTTTNQTWNGLVDLDGFCGGAAGFNGPAYRLSAPAPGLPEGSFLDLTGPGAGDLAWKLDFPGDYTVSKLGADAARLTFGAGWTNNLIQIHAPLAVTEDTTFHAVLTLGQGYLPDVNADLTGFVTISSQTAIRCADDNQSSL